MKNYSQNSQLKGQPAETREMDEKPVTHSSFGNYAGANLKDKVAIITGGDSGIGQAVALLFAGYGIKSVIVHYNEPVDAQFTVDRSLPTPSSLPQAPLPNGWGWNRKPV